MASHSHPRQEDPPLNSLPTYDPVGSVFLLLDYNCLHPKVRRLKTVSEPTLGRDFERAVASAPHFNVIMFLFTGMENREEEG